MNRNLKCIQFLDQLKQLGKDDGGPEPLHPIRTRGIILEHGGLKRLPGIIAERFGTDAKIWVLSDENTEAAAGASCKKLLKKYRIASLVLAAEPKPLAVLDEIEKLAEPAQAVHPDLLLSVGGGTINDIVKTISQLIDVPNWTVPTAPSVDAFTSGTAALRIHGYHKSLAIHPSEYIFCDLDILEQAPKRLFIAGVGDLLAKYSAYLDWKVSSLITGEIFHPLHAEAGLTAARAALEAAAAPDSGYAQAVEKLTDAVLTSGLTMQSLMRSRPASSAEHIIGHLWEMKFAVGNKELDLHGTIVALASEIVCRAYRRILFELANKPPDSAERLQAFRREGPWEEQLAPALDEFRQVILPEINAKAPGSAELEEHLKAIGAHRQEILALGNDIVGEMEEKIRLLKAAGFPLSPAALALDEEVMKVSVSQVRFLRNRYTLFDLAYEAGFSGDFAACV
jgi:glycerol-1-phosphate dehydrogenase [NAD(P)+]